MEIQASEEQPTLKLTVEKGPLAGQTLEFKPGFTIRVGRVVRGNNLTIKDPAVSSKHLTIEFISGDGKWMIRDLDSSNGTFLNDAQLDPSCSATLSDGDVIKIGELTSIKVQIRDLEPKPRRNPRRKGQNDVVAPENCELGLGLDLGKKRRGRPPKNQAQKESESVEVTKSKIKAEKFDDVVEKAESLSVVIAENVDENGGQRRTRNARGRGCREVENAVNVQPQGNTKRSTRRRKQIDLQEEEQERMQCDTEAIQCAEGIMQSEEPQKFGEEGGNGAPNLNTSGAKKDEDDVVENFDDVVEKAESLSVIAQNADENGGQRRTRNARRGCREVENVVNVQPQGNTKRSTRRRKQIDLQEAEQEETQRDTKAIQSEEPPKFGEEGGNGVSNSNTSSAKKDEDEVLEQPKCQDDAIQSVEDGLAEGNGMVEEEQPNSGEEACHVSPNLSGGNKGETDVQEAVNLEVLTLGEWLDYLEIHLPKQIIDSTEEMISEMRNKAIKFQEFMLQQKNAKENQ